MLSNLRRYTAFVLTHSIYVIVLCSVIFSVVLKNPLLVLPLFILCFSSFIVINICFSLTTFVQSKYGTIYYRLTKEGDWYHIITYKYKFGFMLKGGESKDFTFSLDEEKDYQMIKDLVISTKEKSLSKVDKRKLKERTLKSVQKRLMKGDISVHSSDEEFLKQIKEL